MAQALTASGTGVYMIPDPGTAQGTVLYGRGPVATVFFNSNGFPVTDAAALIGGLILALAVGVLIALMLRFIGGDLGRSARVTLLFSQAAVLWLHRGQAVFHHAPWGYTVYLAFSDFLGLVAAGLVAAKIMQIGNGTIAKPGVGGTIHQVRFRGRPERAALNRMQAARSSFLLSHRFWRKTGAPHWPQSRAALPGGQQAMSRGTVREAT